MMMMMMMIIIIIIIIWDIGVWSRKKPNRFKV